MEPILIILSLLTISIITLVFVVVWRDRRDLKLRQITGEIEKVEELLKEMDQYKKEIKEMLATAKKQTDQAVSRVDNQVKQVRDSVVKLEQHVHSGSKDSRDSGRDKARQQKYSGRGKPRNPNKKGQTTPPPPSKGGEQDQRINDGEKFAKMVKMADEGLNTQEIAKRLNIGRKEVELVLQLKRKKIS
jgi:septal ring factor EnvC (AmiA/AmiB activator)